MEDKSKAANRLQANNIHGDLLKELLKLRTNQEILNYCKVSKSKGRGWLISAIRNGWDISYKLKKTREIELFEEPSNYVTGQYADWIEH